MVVLNGFDLREFLFNVIVEFINFVMIWYVSIIYRFFYFVNKYVCY